MRRQMFRETKRNMQSGRFQGKIRYDRECLNRIFCLEYSLFHQRTELLIFLVGAVLVGMAVVLPLAGAFRLMILFAGGWAIVSRELPVMLKAQETWEKRKGNMPLYRLSFTEEFLELSGEGSMRIPYSHFSHLVFDPEYFFLVFYDHTISALGRNEIAEQEAFLDFLRHKTGKNWMKRKNLLLWNLRDVVQSFQHSTTNQ